MDIEWPAPMDRALELRRLDLVQLLAKHGFDPAGDYYRLLSTFEYQMPDWAQMDAANPRVVKVDEAQDQSVDLDLFVQR